MAVLFTQHWEIVHGKEQEYARFAVDQYIPRAEELGLRIVGGYYVAIGKGPRVIAVATSESLDDVENILRMKSMKALQRELMDYVYDYDYKVMAPTGRVAQKEYSIQKGTWKFNQYWDLLPGKIKKYSEFIQNEYIPALEEIGLVKLVGGWNVVLGSGPKILAEMSAPDPSAIGSLFEHDLFRKISRKLRTQYVIRYSSRMLCPTERFAGPELANLDKRY